MDCYHVLFNFVSIFLIIPSISHGSYLYITGIAPCVGSFTQKITVLISEMFLVMVNVKLNAGC